MVTRISPIIFSNSATVASEAAVRAAASASMVTVEGVMLGSTCAARLRTGVSMPGVCIT